MYYEENIDKIREYFESHKSERCPLVNEYLSKKDEYIKSLYFRMLSMLIRYANEPSENQILYIQRLIAGAKTAYSFQDYMRMAIEVEIKDIKEFISILSEDKLKYYFCIDGAILLAMANNEKNFKLFAELIELLGITKEEVNYLMALVRAVCMQDSNLFDGAKTLATKTTKSLDLYHYVKEFYSGAIVDTPLLLHITSCKKGMVDLSAYQIFDAREVIIENIIDELDQKIQFKNCKKVVIRNCKLEGKNDSLFFDNIESVVIENCEIFNFSNRFAIFRNVNEVIFRHNEFRDCGCTVYYGWMGGGVILGFNCDNVLFDSNELLNCYITYDEKISNHLLKGVLFHSESSATNIAIVDNIFSRCECRNVADHEKSYISGNFSDISASGNTCIGSITRIFEDSDN